MLSEHIFFVIERITDIFKLKKKNGFGISNNLKRRIQELQEELGRNYNHLRQLEAKCDDKIVFSEHENQYYRNLGTIAHYCDKFLDHITNNDDSFDKTFYFGDKYADRQAFLDNLASQLFAGSIVDDGVTSNDESCDEIGDGVTSNDESCDEIFDVESEICGLVKSIQNSYNSLLSQPTYIFYTGQNTNLRGGIQIVKPTYISFNHGEPSQSKQDPRPTSFGHKPNPHLVGFNHEIQTLLNHLLQTYDDETRFVGIVGMGGSGKTTLARHIYQHPQINTRFTTKVWVCVSRSWDKTVILNEIWKQATKNTTTDKIDYDQVVRELYEFLSSKTYLIILDDIWSIDIWSHIYEAIPTKGSSAIVVTTRIKEVPKTIESTVLIVEPKQLNDEQSYELFNRRSSLLDKKTPHDLRSLGMEMVKKCKGLPLAIITLAGVLQMNISQSSWQRISKRLTDHILAKKNASKEGVVKEVLALSYDELPHDLKPCALYLNVFPEDHEIEAQKLIQMWIAERFMNEESIAEEYLEEMAQRCIVEVVRTNYEGRVLKFRIHDLIRQMFIDIGKERDILRNPSFRLVPRTTLYGDGCKNFNSRMEILDSYLYGNSHVRSLIFLDFQDRRNLKLLPLFIKLKLLRVLILDDVPWNKLPEEIGNLIHLRYLEISGQANQFPGSIGNLENLWTLDIRNFDTSLVEINLEKLKELRHLYMSTRKLNYMAKKVKTKVMGLEKLKKLKTLWGVQAGDWMLSVMPELSNVLEQLYIWGIEKQKELEVVFRTPSINKLHTLELQWLHDFYPTVKLRDMSILSKCKSLKKLKLNGKIQFGKPIMFPTNLIYLEMKNTYMEEKQVLTMISDSCPLLKILILGANACWGTELVCNENAFPQLEKFALTTKYLELWTIETDAMPKLNHLIIEDSMFLDLNHEGWERISLIPTLTFLKQSYATAFKEKFRQRRKDWTHCIKEAEDWYVSELE